MRRMVLALCMCAIGSQSAALSCMQPEPMLTFNQVLNAPEPFYVLHGTLRFAQKDLPPRMRDGGGAAPDPVPADFSGTFLTADGFTNDLDMAVNLQVSCTGPWCGAAQSGVEALFFVPVTDGTVTIVADPCASLIFPNPAPAVLAAITACMQGGDCSTQTFEK